MSPLEVHISIRVWSTYTFKIVSLVVKNLVVMVYVFFKEEISNFNANNDG